MKIPFKTPQIDRTWLTLGSAVILSLIAAWLSFQYLDYRTASIEEEVKEKAKKDQGNTVAVVVPVRNLQPGTVLDPSVVAARPVSSDFVYEDTLLAGDFDKFKGQALIRGVVQGRPLRRQDVREVFSDFAGSVPEGKRAITIDVDELNSVANMIQPGNVVDLMLVIKGEGAGPLPGQSEAGVVPFLSKVRVLATGQTVTHEGEGGKPGARRVTYTNLTLEVTPFQGARIAMAQEIGKLRAVLRNEKDAVDPGYGRVDAGNVLEDEGSRPGAQGRPGSARGVEFIIGGKGSSGVGTPMNVPMPAGAASAAPAAPAGLDMGAMMNSMQQQVTSQIMSQFGGKKSQGANAAQ